MAVKVTKDATAALNVFLNWTAKQQVLVGIPAEKTDRADGELTNAQLGYIHEYGAPEANIPARPWLSPGMEAAKADIATELERGLRQGLERAALNDRSAAQGEILKALERTGLKSVSKIRGRVTAGLSPPLAPRTIQARMHRKKNRRSGGDMKPLIDTAQLLRSITYVIRQRGRS